MYLKLQQDVSYLGSYLLKYALKYVHLVSPTKFRSGITWL